MRCELSTLVTLCLALTALACGGEHPVDPTAPELENLGTLAAAHHGKGSHGNGGGGGGGGGKITYSVVLVSHPAFSPSDPTLLSTCPGSAESSKYHVTWPRFTECVTITPTGGYQLNNDPELTVSKKGGVITRITFFIDDIVGPDGIQHETDRIPIDPPTEPSTAGFTLHVHADGVEVWRLSGHIGGPRVEMIGTISIADVVYQVP